MRSNGTGSSAAPALLASLWDEDGPRAPLRAAAARIDARGVATHQNETT